MQRETVRTAASAMPPTSPAFPTGPYRFSDREYFIIQYRTDPEALRRVVPEPLAIIEPVVNCEFIRMPDSWRHGRLPVLGCSRPANRHDNRRRWRLDGPIVAGERVLLAPI
jgi:acetoacetate decarboxylase